MAYSYGRKYYKKKYGYKSYGRKKYYKNMPIKRFFFLFSTKSWLNLKFFLYLCT